MKEKNKVLHWTIKQVFATITHHYKDFRLKIKFTDLDLKNKTFGT